MATIRATCTVCGDVELGTADVRVRVDPSNNQGTYSFLCPRCSSLVVKPAQPRTIDLLLASGVQYDMATTPLETTGPRATGGPIAERDIVAFSDLLHDDGRLWAAFEDADSHR
jgi:hypothetical protein